MWEVYIIESEAGQLYTGITTDVERRFAEHETSRGARFFRKSAPKAIVYREAHPDRSSASRREHEIKQFTRSQKLDLIDRASS